jgi:cytidylate kinase
MGSLGKDVAAGVAERLGLRLMYHEIVDTLAEELHVDSSSVTRLVDGKPKLADRWKVDASALALFTAEQILDIALQGNVVIRGWGATYLLRSVPHIPCVRVSAPLPLRITYMMQRMGTDDYDKVLHEIRRSDAAHARILRRQFGANYEDPWLYDVIFNTERDSVEFCVDEIIGMVNHPNFAETAESRTLLKQMALKAHIRAALRKSPSTTKIHITIQVTDNRVTLEGIVENEREQHAVEEIVAGVRGVVAVENHLRSMTGVRYLAAEASI